MKQGLAKIQSIALPEIRCRVTTKRSPTTTRCGNPLRIQSPDA